MSTVAVIGESSFWSTRTPGERDAIGLTLFSLGLAFAGYSVSGWTYSVLTIACVFLLVCAWLLPREYLIGRGIREVQALRSEIEALRIGIRMMLGEEPPVAQSLSDISATAVGSYWAARRQMRESAQDLPLLPLPLDILLHACRTRYTMLRLKEGKAPVDPSSDPLLIPQMLPGRSAEMQFQG